MSESKNIRVLIVDDFALTRAILKVILRSDNFDVVGEAGDGEEGLVMALKLRPEMILLDNFMPVKNGIEILPDLRAKLPKSMILMVTSGDEMEYVKQAISLGANGYIVKPFNSESVIETIKSAHKKFVHADAAAFVQHPINPGDGT